jgi:lipid-A-disaccharide synthase
MTDAPIFILAGEPSGDQLAAHMMKAVTAGFGPVDWVGVGGPAMCEQGLTSVMDMDALTIFGFGRALSSYLRLSRLMDRLVDDVMAMRPRLVLTVDVKGFSLRFAGRLRRRMQQAGWSAPIVHTVAPTVWAWGAWRAGKFAAAMDGILCLFPFEPAYFTRYRLPAQFIGHPEAFLAPAEMPSRPRSPDGKKTVLLLPGSRRSEVDLILPDMVAAAQILNQDNQNKIRFILPAVPRWRQHIETMVAGAPWIDVVDGGDALGRWLCAADAMMATSGTITLQTALYGVPGVTAYRSGYISAAIGRRLVNFDKVILPNAILGREVYPFLFQQQLNPHALAAAVQSCLDDEAHAISARQTAGALRACLTGGMPAFGDMLCPALAPWLESGPAR